MRKILFIILILFSVFLQAQTNKSKHWEVNSFSMLESKNLNSDFFIDFYSGQFLDSTLKYDALAELKSNNNLGFHSLNTITYSQLKADKKIGFFISGSYQKIMGLEFSAPLFELVFIGNESFSGHDLELNPLNLELHEFIDVQGGVIWEFNENSFLFASAGPVLGLNYQSILNADIRMYTSELTDSIALDYNAVYKRTASFPMINGYGFSSTIGAGGQHAGINWKFSISNLGILWYNKRSVSSIKDSLIEFNGFEINELSNISNDLDEELNRIENSFNLAGDTGNIQTVLPLKIEATAIKKLYGFKLDLYALYLNIPGFIPYTSLSISRPIFKTLAICLPLKYGGFGGFNAGIGLESDITESISLRIYSPTLLNIIGLNNNLSFGIFTSLVFKMKDNESSF